MKNALTDTLLEKYRHILRPYNLGAIRTATELEGGMFLTPLLLDTDDGKFVLRGTRFRPSVQLFEFQAATMNYAAESGVRCPRVLPDQEGSFGYEQDGAVWALYEYVDGRLYDWHDWCGAIYDRRGFVERLAGHVAHMHDVLSEAMPPGAPELSPDLPPIQFRYLQIIRDCWCAAMDPIGGLASSGATQSRDALRKNRDRLDEHWQWLHGQAAALNICDLPHQIVHGDVSPANLVFAHDGECGFIDWDTVHLGIRLYDALGDVMIRPPWDEPSYHRLRPNVVSRYLAAYQSATTRPFGDRELACVPAFCLARQLEDLRQRVATLGELLAERDAEYAVLIETRLSLMDEIRRTGPEDWIEQEY